MSKRVKDIVVNRKARHDYHLEDRFEAGIVLRGGEVKSLRAGEANLQEAYVRVDKGEAWLVGCHISPYTFTTQDPPEPRRPRKLLLHRNEIAKLEKGTRQKGMTLVPLRLYFKGSNAKLELALGKGKKLHDKRHDLKARTAKREMERGR